MTQKAKSSRLVAFEEDALEIMNQWEQACVKANSNPRKETFLAFKRCAHNLKGNAGLIGFDSMKDAVHRLEDRLISLEESPYPIVESSLIGIFFEIERFLRFWITSSVNDPNFKPDSLNVLSKLEAWAPNQSAAPTNTGVERLGESLIGDLGPSNFDSVKIPSQKLDALIQQVGELTLAQAIISRGRLNESLDSLAVKEAILLGDKLVRNLRQTVLDLRMLPMAGLYSKLERAAMELSIQLQKPLHLLVEGQDVAIDKAVLNRIFDPLLHMLRNAIDHGIESPTERVANGKEPAGTIKLTASVVPSGVQISIKDDGRGLDHEKIRQKGIERGLIKASDVVNNDYLSNLIFEPGFSTATAVTDVSGRGIGLDIVKKELLNLSGQLTIKTESGLGTEFLFTLPTNISLIDVLVVDNRGHIYCVPTQDVSEILDLKEVKIETSAAHRQMAKLRNKVLPIEPLEYFLHQNKLREAAEGDQGCILVVQYNDQSIGLRVDGVIDQQQVFVRPLRGYLASLNNITGSTVLSSGEPSLIVNVKGMVDEFIENKRRGDRLGEQSI